MALPTPFQHGTAPRYFFSNAIGIVGSVDMPGVHQTSFNGITLWLGVKEGGREGGIKGGREGGREGEKEGRREGGWD